MNHWIGGASTPGTSDRTSPVFNPATGQVTDQLPLASAADLDGAVKVAADTFASWRQTSLGRRAEILFRARAIFDERREELAKIISSEHGKVPSDALGEIARGIENVEFACGIPNLLKGGFSEQVAGGVDVFSIRQPL
ncbi:MAG TPA: aldehyde dehydrogenase family protein, partial [Microthrixaceae bacterium]|nr:aldehyde dehydrogenase family protein [Microthrixaceae bacterium]